MVTINADFEAGSISIIKADSANDIQLSLKGDNAACAKQWFYFSVESLNIEQHTISIENAGNSSFTGGWTGYQAFASYDNDEWFRVDTHYYNGKLVIRHNAKRPITYYAYFVPYLNREQIALNALVSKANNATIETLGFTALNRPIELIRIGDNTDSAKQLWIIARQHPGETVAQWVAHGAVEMLLQLSVLRELTNVTCNIVTNMNPDGSFFGNHRTNSAGIDLNRQWHNPNIKSCPEVFYVKKAMEAKGVDAFLDLHADETLPFNFLMEEEKKPIGELVKYNLAQLNSYFQHKKNYDSVLSGCNSASCSSSCQSKKATTFIKERFGAISLLFEGSIKNIETAKGIETWNEHTAIQLGKDLISVLIDSLKGEFSLFSKGE